MIIRYIPPLGGGATKHTELTEKDPVGVIDHGDGTVTDSKLASGVGLADGQIAKLPTAVSGQVLRRGATAWEAGKPPPADLSPLIVSNWQTRTSPADNWWRSVCWSPERGLFVAVADSGAGNRVMTSLYLT